MSGCFNAAGDTIAMAGVSIGGGIGLRDPKIRTRERLKGARGNGVNTKDTPEGLALEGWCVRPSTPLLEMSKLKVLALVKNKYERA